MESSQRINTFSISISTFFAMPDSLPPPPSHNEFITNNNLDEYLDRQDNPSNQEPRQSSDAYEQGLGFYRNLEFAKALDCFLKAANEGNADAQDRAGTMYRCGSGTLQDYNKALFWYRKAANQGYVTSQINLGSMYQNGYGATRDDHKAIFWYEKAAEQGSAIAQCNLGMMYQEGHGVAPSSIKALNWYRKAALQGDAFAQYYMGGMYHYGTDSLSKHYINAERFYEQAAKQGHVDTERKLEEVRNLLDSPPPDPIDSIPKTKIRTL